MPKDGSFVEFHDGQNQFKVPFVMYLYFEAILKQTKGSNPNPEAPYTKEINQHIPLVLVLKAGLLMEMLRIH